MLLLRWLWFFTKVSAVGLWWLLRVSGSAVQSAVSADFRAKGSLGTARWATGWERVRYRVYSGVGPIVGKGAFGRLLRFNRDGIVHVFANTGAGKGIGVVVPTLLDYPGSIVVTDVKGENYAITARYRSTLGRVVMLNPGDLRHSARFNPLDMVRVGTDQESDDARMLADLMVIRDGPDAHWSDKSISLLSALILHAVYANEPAQRNLAYVRRLSLAESGSMREQIEDIARGSPSRQARDIARAFLRSMGDQDKSTNEFLSVLSDLDKATEPWGDGTPAGQLASRSSFSLEDLNRPETMTLYLCVDEEKLLTYRRWLRVMTGCTLNAVMRSKRTQRPKHKVILLYDEARALGRLDPLINAVGFLRTYCTPVLIWQNMPQVRAIYGEQAAEFLANASCRVFFGINDNDTAKQVSLMCGQAAIRTQSQGTSHSSEAWLRENHSQNVNEGGYWLIDPSEVQRLRTDEVIIKFAHVPYPLMARRANYLHRYRWRLRWDAWTPEARPVLQVAEPAPPAPRRPPRPPVPDVEDEPLPPPRPYAAATPVPERDEEPLPPPRPFAPGARPPASR